MKFKSVNVISAAWLSVILAVAAVSLLPTQSLAEPDHVERLNAPIGDLKVPTPLKRRLEQLSHQKFSRPLSAAPVRWFMSDRFFGFVENQRGGHEVAGRLQTFMATQSFPVNLTGAELELYHMRPDHAVFGWTDLDVEANLKDFLVSHQLNYVIDAVKLLKSPHYAQEPYATSDVILDLRDLVLRQLGQDAGSFDARAIIEDIKRQNKPSRPSFAECERIMSTMTNDELQRAFVGIMSRRLKTDGE